MDWRLRLPAALYRLAVDKAGSDKASAELVVGLIEAWVKGDTAQAKAGRARAASMPTEERSALATQAAPSVADQRCPRHSRCSAPGAHM
jgi:hypothetical protein